MELKHKQSKLAELLDAFLEEVPVDYEEIEEEKKNAYTIIIYIDAIDERCGDVVRERVDKEFDVFVTHALNVKSEKIPSSDDYRDSINVTKAEQYREAVDMKKFHYKIYDVFRITINQWRLLR